MIIRRITKMKYCKKCGVLYDESLPGCPKCNPVLETILQDRKDNAPQADKKTIKKQWIMLLIGVPALILVLYGVIWLMRELTT